MNKTYTRLTVKHHSELTWDDMPHIESPLFAESKLRLESQGQGIAWYDNRRHHTLRWATHQNGIYPTEMTEQRMREALRQGEYVVLVQQPFLCPLRWHADTAHPQGGEWRKNGDGLHKLTWAIKRLEVQRHIATIKIKAQQEEQAPVRAARSSVFRIQLASATWSRTNIPVGDAVEVCFTVRDAQGGESVTIKVFETNSDGSETMIDEFSHTADAGTQRCKIPWTRSTEDAYADLQQDEQRQDTAPVNYVFEASIGDASPVRSRALYLTHTLHVTAQRDDDEPLPEGADVALRAADGKLHHGVVKDGVVEYKGVVLGPFKLVMDGQG